jgi:hypothetical protein
MSLGRKPKARSSGDFALRDPSMKSWVDRTLSTPTTSAISLTKVLVTGDNAAGELVSVTTRR